MPLVKQLIAEKSGALDIGISYNVDLISPILLFNCLNHKKPQFIAKYLYYFDGVKASWVALHWFRQKL